MTEAKGAGTLRTLRELPPGATLLVAGIAINRMGSFVPIFLILYATAEVGYSTARAGLALTAYGVGTIVGCSPTGTDRPDRGTQGNRRLDDDIGSPGGRHSPTFGNVLRLMLSVVAGAGIVGQLYRPASVTFLAELTPADRLVMTSAAMRLGLNTGAALGPLLGSLLALHSYTLVFLTDAEASLVFAALIQWLLPRSSGHDATTTPDSSQDERRAAYLRSSGQRLPGADRAGPATRSLRRSDEHEPVRRLRAGPTLGAALFAVPGGRRLVPLRGTGRRCRGAALDRTDANVAACDPSNEPST